MKIITSINFFLGSVSKGLTTVKIGQEWADIKEKLSTFNLGFAKARMDRLLLNQWPFALILTLKKTFALYLSAAVSALWI